MNNAKGQTNNIVPKVQFMDKHDEDENNFSVNVVQIDEGKEIKVELSGLKNKNVELALYNTIGNVVFKDKLRAQSNFTSLNITPNEHLTKGLYFLSVVTGNKKITKKLILKHF
ncbi:T9SS type A sorting domain-containing protein [Rapidithrix thailandica]|uniref:T9SS type A sorting domain-containing protein n=1 Tax=Rapidithrix thailandica TaxID=413964 RepID=A0AAW9S604_9BACT